MCLLACYHFLCFFSLRRSRLILLSCPWGTAFNVHSNAGRLPMNSVSFCMSEKVLVLATFLKDISASYWIPHSLLWDISSLSSGLHLFPMTSLSSLSFFFCEYSYHQIWKIFNNDFFRYFFCLSLPPFTGLWLHISSAWSYPTVRCGCFPLKIFVFFVLHSFSCYV